MGFEIQDLYTAKPAIPYIYENTDTYILSISLDWNTNCTFFNLSKSTLAFGHRVALDPMFLGLLRQERPTIAGS
jgi:hypothetical protein